MEFSQASSPWNLRAFGIADDDSSSVDSELPSLYREDGGASRPLHSILPDGDDASIEANASSRSNHYALAESSPSFLAAQSSEGCTHSGPHDSEPSSAALPATQARHARDATLRLGERFDLLSSAEECTVAAAPSSDDVSSEQLERRETAAVQQRTTELLRTVKNFKDIGTEAVLALPFPLFVFGTLRMHLNNNYLMGVPARPQAAVFSGSHFRRDQHIAVGFPGSNKAKMIGHCCFDWWAPAGVRFTYCEGIRIHAATEQQSPSIADLGKGVAALGEIFVYDNENFAKVIGPVDELESFQLCNDGRRSGTCSYVRTLMWADVLPRSMRSELSLDLGRQRYWQPQRFSATCATEHHARIPVWVYSSILTNVMIAKGTPPGSVLLWAPHSVPASECGITETVAEEYLIRR